MRGSQGHADWWTSTPACGDCRVGSGRAPATGLALRDTMAWTESLTPWHPLAFCSDLY